MCLYEMSPATSARGALRYLQMLIKPNTQGVNLMNATNKTALVIAFALVLVLLLLFGGGAMSGATLSGGMMGNGVMGGISWMWIPVVLMLGLGVLLVWIIFEQKK
jgi:hypothetical protein